MRLLILGKAGQVAQSLARHSSDHQMVFLGRPELDFAEPHAAAQAFRAHLESLPTYDAVMNAAAYTAVDQAETEEALASKINAETPGLLAGVCANYGIPFFHLSTDYVFAGDKPAPYVEDDPVAPEGVYGRSKLAGEQAVLAAHPGATVCRTAWVFSPYGKNFVKTMLRLAETRDELSVVADQIGNPSYAPDIASALVRLAEHTTSGKVGGIYHLAGMGDVSWHGFAEAIFTESAKFGGKLPKVKPISTAEYPTPAKRPANSRLNCARLQRDHNIVLPHWTDALKRCIAELNATKD